MKVKSNKLIVTLLILSLMSMGTVYGEDGASEEVAEMLDEKILNLEELIREIEKKQKVLSKITRVQDYVKMDLGSNIDKVLEIEKNTPLDMEAAAVVVAYSEKFNINPSLILAIIKQESNFSKYEVGADEDRGYMQIIPSTEKWLANKFGKLIGIEYDPSKIYNPEYNIGLGTIYLSILKNNHGENYNKILSEYNRGPYNLKAYYNKHKTYTTSYSRGVLRKEKNFLKFNK